MESFFMCIFSAACAFLPVNGLEKTFKVLSQELDRQAIPSFNFSPISTPTGSAVQSARFFVLLAIVLSSAFSK